MRTDRPLAVETRGIEPVPDHERYGSPIGLFWMWCGANIGILGITLGAILVTVGGLDVAQTLLVAVVGAGLSFLLVGVLSLAGPRGGAPGLTLSRAVFGVRGNRGPTLVSWLGFVGWETVICTTAAFALLALLDVFGVARTVTSTTVCVLVTVVLAATVGVCGHGTIMWVQKWLTWVFGALTLAVLGLLSAHVDWTAAMDAPPAPVSHVVAGIGLIAAGTGIGWLSAGADFARYLPRGTSARSVVGATVAGASLPLVVLIVTGALMAGGEPDLAAASDPIAAVGASLPGWMLVPFLLSAAAGLIASANLSMYSSGLNLITAGIPVRRTTAVAVDATLITIGGLYLTVMAQDFYGAFTSFLTLLAIPLAAWAAVFGVDVARRTAYDASGLLDPTPGGPYWYHGGVRVQPVITWLVAIVVGLGFASLPSVYTGWWAHTWLGSNGLAWLVAGGVALVLALPQRRAE